MPRYNDIDDNSSSDHDSRSGRDSELSFYEPSSPPHSNSDIEMEPEPAPRTLPTVCAQMHNFSCIPHGGDLWGGWDPKWHEEMRALTSEPPFSQGLSPSTFPILRDDDGDRWTDHPMLHLPITTDPYRPIISEFVSQVRTLSRERSGINVPLNPIQREHLQLLRRLVEATAAFTDSTYTMQMSQQRSYVFLMKEITDGLLALMEVDRRARIVLEDKDFGSED
ncbi:hypothetical protein K474DRAFT_1659255 [Panus rudis PR-1116 ss-1]|nr:hypothetical protein K474DRAFT_1659255 [Panus rudis PR-1116 ss-1]